jgi:hypothetical protein
MMTHVMQVDVKGMSQTPPLTLSIPSFYFNALKGHLARFLTFSSWLDISISVLGSLITLAPQRFGWIESSILKYEFIS